MQVDPEPTLEIDDPSQQNEDHPILFRDDEQIDREVLRRERPATLEVGIRCRPSAVNLLLSDSGYKDRAPTLASVHHGQLLNQ